MKPMVDKKVSLKTNMDTCSKSSECCCGQGCFEYYQAWNSNTTNQTYLCQCDTNRWWNNDIPYCRKLIIFRTHYFKESI